MDDFDFSRMPERHERRGKATTPVRRPHAVQVLRLALKLKIWGLLSCVVAGLVAAFGVYALPHSEALRLRGTSGAMISLLITIFEVVLLASGVLGILAYRKISATPELACGRKALVLGLYLLALANLAWVLTAHVLMAYVPEFIQRHLGVAVLVILACCCAEQVMFVLLLRTQAAIVRAPRLATHCSEWGILALLWFAALLGFLVVECARRYLGDKAWLSGEWSLFAAGVVACGGLIMQLLFLRVAFLFLQAADSANDS